MWHKNTKTKTNKKTSLILFRETKYRHNLKLLLFRGKREEWTGREKTPPPDYQVVKFFYFLSNFNDDDEDIWNDDRQVLRS